MRNGTASHPYRTFEGTSTWTDADDIFAALEVNGDIALHPARAHVSGDVRAQLGRRGPLAPPGRAARMSAEPMPVGCERSGDSGLGWLIATEK